MKERQVDPETPLVPKRDTYIYIYICSAQTVDRDHPWIVLRKPWIGDIHALTRQTMDHLRKAWIRLAQSVDMEQTVDHGL